MDDERLPHVAQEIRGVKAVDILMFGGVALFFLIVTIGAILTKQEWPWAKILVLTVVDMAGVGICALYFIKKWMARPDYVTKHGVAFWTNGVDDATKELMEKALDHFIEQIQIEGHQFNIPEASLREMLARTGVEWNSGRVSLITTRYELTDKAGIQHGYRLLVQWRGSIADSAFYHELLHEVNEFIRLPRLKTNEEMVEFRLEDIQHLESEYWRLDGALQPNF